MYTIGDFHRLRKNDPQYALGDPSVKRPTIRLKRFPSPPLARGQNQEVQDQNGLRRSKIGQDLASYDDTVNLGLLESLAAIDGIQNFDWDESALAAIYSSIWGSFLERLSSALEDIPGHGRQMWCFSYFPSFATLGGPPTSDLFPNSRKYTRKYKKGQIGRRAELNNELGVRVALKALTANEVIGFSIWKGRRKMNGEDVVLSMKWLPDETVETYTWVLTTLMEAMDGKKPVSVVTDSDMAMQQAIKSVSQTSIVGCAHGICNLMSFFTPGLRLCGFVVHVDRGVNKIRFKDVKAEAVIDNNFPVMETTMKNLERHRAEDFTRAIFLRFRNEIEVKRYLSLV
ncbi:hypothetical protein RHMOL_Rhmol05G0082900 [Rhododendron molle]|uniref:Uncharacterized protein n=1 Tax=Rhododendron molle TaxID=49168 RepID=A0ACC0NLJ4_RHOML|nr:hypothetical protein RHMOL_Rhmol05G0082900 [Rhododendron molle]